MTKVKILLVDFQERMFSNLQDPTANQTVLPVGLMYLSSYVKSRVDNAEVKLAKSFVDFSDKAQLTEMIGNFSPDIIGIRGLSLDVESLLNYVRELRSLPLNKRQLIVLGGPITNANTRDVYMSGLFDHVVVGDGERAFGEIVEAFVQGREIDPDVPGILDNPDECRRDVIEPLDSLPMPDYSLIDFGAYDRFMNYGYNRRRQAVVLTSRGCPYKCAYCHRIFGNRVRLRSADNVLEEIEHLHSRYDIDDFFIVDDVFNVDYRRAIRVFELIIERGLKINLYFPNGIRGDIADRHYIDLMTEAGTRYLAFAVETASQRLQKFIGKNMNLEKLKSNIEYACGKDILVNAFFMFGLPSETEEEAMLTLKYAKELDKLNFPFVFFARYYPGTQMYDLAQQNGFSEEMLRTSNDSLYHDTRNYRTPTLSDSFIQFIKDYFLYGVLLDEKRVDHMLRVQARFYGEDEIATIINSMYNLKVNSTDEFSDYVKLVNRSPYVRGVRDRFAQLAERHQGSQSAT